ncbi:unannotated protein [freshwater metagenome]|uniref:Unannotated protein n=1 Tax=freshwater metagenome TaxID=449393 RepID=A0A6J7GVY2_9ZZZZ|nr:hypothetical protein [Actinomycetota bacterium]
MQINRIGVRCAVVTALVAIGFVAPAGLATTASAVAAEGTGTYAQWTLNAATTAGTISFGNAYPTATFVTNASGPSPDRIKIATEDFLNASTPVGKAYGSSEGSSYLWQRHTSRGGPWTTVITFATPMPAGAWAFALGDLDVDSITISATNVNGQPAKIAPWFQSTFNWCVGANQPSGCEVPPSTAKPIWDGKDSLRGLATETEGASAWLRPTVAIKTLTLKWAAQRNWYNSSYRLWMVADGPGNRQSVDCAALPESLPSVGVTRIAAPGCITDAGQPVAVSVTCVSELARKQPRGDLSLCRQITGPRGGVAVQTFGQAPASITITLTAPATQGYRAYRVSRTYSVT